MKKTVVFVAMLFIGLFPFLSTRPAHFRSQNQNEANSLFIREKSIKNRFQKEKFSDKFNELQKKSTVYVPPVAGKIKYSSRHRKGKIVYSAK